MAEYIEREAAIGFVKNLTPHMDGWTTLNAVEVSLQNTPAADVVEVRHGEWVDTGILELDTIYGGWKCSLCGDIVCGSKPNYCGNCGAKMDGKGEGE